MRTLRVLIALGLGFVALLCGALVAPANAAPTAAEPICIATPAASKAAVCLPVRSASTAAAMLATRDRNVDRALAIPSPVGIRRSPETRWFRFADPAEPPSVAPRPSGQRIVPPGTEPWRVQGIGSQRRTRWASPASVPHHRLTTVLRG